VKPTFSLSFLAAFATVLLPGICPLSLLANDDRAKRIAPLLKPAAQPAKGTKKDIAVPKDSTIKIIELLQNSDRTNGPSAESVIETAYRHRKDVAPLEQLITTSALLRNWREAQALGLFTDNHSFKSIITRGPDKGKLAMVEYIVPPEHIPQMSMHPANIRIIGPSRKRRGDGKKLTAREASHLEQFRQMITESKARSERIKNSKGANFANAGLTVEQENEKWIGAMRKAGEAGKKVPTIIVRARKGASPAHGNNHRWRVDSEVVNTSSHPTKVQLEYWLIGITDKKDIHYAMARNTQDLQLLAGQAKQVSLWTGSEQSYKKKAAQLDGYSKGDSTRVMFRGWIVRVLHGKKVVATETTDLGLEQYLKKDGDRKLASLK
jgi:hypothetical protein